MKFLTIFLTLVCINSVQANNDKAIDQVRLSLWYQGVDKEEKKAEPKKEESHLESKKINIPEELIKALDKV